ncbi:MAG: beta-lactamase family protein, partial [Verrucomicrobiales bacterium]|nr:beta-lactamase family protein [Verrucomicrobiales bacterium]
CGLIVAAGVAGSLMLGFVMAQLGSMMAESTPINLPEKLKISAESSDAELRSQLTELAESFVEKETNTGIVIAVTRAGKREIVPRGLLQAGGDDPISETTLFEIGSVSKSITGLVMAEQVTTGKLKFDSEITPHLPDAIPELKIDDEAVTFGHLVTHNSGFPRLAFNTRPYAPPFQTANPYAGFSEADLLKAITVAEGKLDRRGKDFNYSNFGFATLAWLLGKNGESTFPELQKSVTDRLGMQDTWIELPEEKRSVLATGHLRGVEIPYWFDGGLYINGAGSTVSTAVDLCAYLEALMGPNSIEGNLKEALKLAITTQNPFNEQDRSGIAFGWFYQRTPGVRRVFGHSGATAGFSSFVEFQPGSRTGIIVLSNSSSEDVNRIGKLIAKSLFL